MNQSIISNVSKTFIDMFGDNFLLGFSPGRINIIGEHTDYNQGFVLPASIDKGCYAAAGKSDDKNIKLFSPHFSKNCESNVEQLRPTDEGWPNYILGVADQLIKRGYPVSGFNMVIDGDVPVGSGMSSSAAMECAVVITLDALFELNLTRIEMAHITQQAEQTFSGVMVGIMDQFASLYGKAGSVIKLDCRSLEYEYKPFSFDRVKVLLLNTNVSHSLASSEYNKRREECFNGVKILQALYPQIQSLREVNMDMLLKHVKPVDELIFNRCSYVVEENIRLLKACEFLDSGDLSSLGKLLFGSHQGLSKKYEVSCAELDFLVDLVKDIPEVKGARMMGGGFGGCTINIVEEDAIEKIIDVTSRAYQERFSKAITPYTTVIEDGGRILNK